MQIRLDARGAPQVTSAMPVRNGEPLLVSAIKSIRWQAFTEWRSRVSGNGSSVAIQRILSKIGNLWYRFSGKVAYG
jgi:hypothetical protein